ncbi:uncharacterized protein LOC144101745 [Amblyomma americanum]
MVKCFVPNCSTGTGLCTEKRSLFGAPLDDERRAKWNRAIGRPDRELALSDRVCERHFEPHLIIRTWKRVYRGRIITGERIPCLTKDAVPSIFEPSPASQRVEAEAKAVKKRKKEPNEAATPSQSSKARKRVRRNPPTKRGKCNKKLNRGSQRSRSKCGEPKATTKAAAKRKKPNDSTQGAPTSGPTSECGTVSQSTLARSLRCYGRPNRGPQGVRSTVECSESDVTKEAPTRREKPVDSTLNMLQNTVSSESPDSTAVQSTLAKSLRCYGRPSRGPQSVQSTVKCGESDVTKRAPTRHEKPSDSTRDMLPKTVSSECESPDSTVARSTLAKSLRCYGRLGRSQQSLQSTVDGVNSLVNQNNLSKTVRCYGGLNHGVQSFGSTVESGSSKVKTEAAMECKGPLEMAQNLPLEAVNRASESADNSGIQHKQPCDATSGLLGVMTVCDNTLPERAVRGADKPFNGAHNLPSDATCLDVSSHMSSAHDLNNRLDCGGTPTRVTVKLEMPNDTTAAGAVLSCFDDLFSIAKQIKLPSNSWGVHCVNVDGVRDIVFSELVVRHEPLVTAVHSPKTVHVKSDMSVSVLLLGKPVQSISGISTEFSSVAELEELLKALDAVCVCRGGPTLKMYPVVEPVCAYIDSFKHWRHVKCPIVVTNKGTMCKWCHGLYETLRMNMSRILARKRAGASLKRIRIPLTGGENRLALLRQATESLQESNGTLRTQLQALRAELAGVKKEFGLGQEGAPEGHFDTAEAILSSEEEGDMASEEEDEGMAIEEEKDVSFAQIYVVY